MSIIKTRKPTGAVPAPNILIVGEEGSGKTYAAFALSASPRVGTTYVIDYGEGCADQYADLGPYEVVEHDGTLEGLAEIAQAISEIPVDPARPHVVVLDSVSTVWDAAKQWAEDTARARKSIAQNGEPVITMDVWNAANRKFYRVIDPLCDWPGIVILTARGRWAAALDDKGRPIKNQKEWSAETQKRLGFAVDVVLRSQQPRKLEVEKARTLKLKLPADTLLDISGTSLDEFIFDMLGVESAGERNTVRPDSRVELRAAQFEVLGRFKELGYEDPKAAAREFWDSLDEKPATRGELDEVLSRVDAPAVDDTEPLDEGEPVEEPAA